MNEIDISKFDKAAVLAALYNRARPQGLGILHYKSETMTQDDAAALLTKQKYFDYVRGRVMKVDLSGEVLRPGLYDRDNGTGAAQQALVDAGLIKTER